MCLIKNIHLERLIAYITHADECARFKYKLVKLDALVTNSCIYVCRENGVGCVGMTCTDTIQSYSAASCIIIIIMTKDTKPMYNYVVSLLASCMHKCIGSSCTFYTI